MPSVRQFIDSYDSTLEARISFKWNGLHGDEFADGNYDFRKQVLGAVVDSPDSVPILLLRDLFRAETELAKEAWGVDMRLREIAAALLKRGRARYALDFIEGMGRGFDAAVLCRTVEVEPAVAREIVTALEATLPHESEKDQVTLLSTGLEFFRNRAERA